MFGLNLLLNFVTQFHSVLQWHFRDFQTVVLIYESMCKAKIQGKLLELFSVFWNFTQVKYITFLDCLGVGVSLYVTVNCQKKTVDFMVHAPGSCCLAH